MLYVCLEDFFEEMDKMHPLSLVFEFCFDSSRKLFSNFASYSFIEPLNI